MIRKPFPKGPLDLLSASPMGDRGEFKAAFEAAKAGAPGVALSYVGTDGASHYFQEHGNREAYVVPVTRGWKPAPIARSRRTP